MGLMVQGSNPVGGEVFRTFPDRPWGPPSLMYNGYWVFPGGVKSGRGVTLTPHLLLVPWSWKGRAILYSPYGLYGLYRGCTLPLPLHLMFHFEMQISLLLCEVQRLRWSRGSVLAFGTQVCGFKPGRSRRIFKGQKNSQHAFLWRGSKAIGPMS